MRVDYIINNMIKDVSLAIVDLEFSHYKCTKKR